MANKIESWKSDGGTVFDNEYAAVVDDLRVWLLNSVSTINEPIVRDIVNTITKDSGSLNTFNRIIDAVNGSFRGHDQLADPGPVNVTKTMKRFDPDIERRAAEIFEAMPDRPMGLAWEPHGNSVMQDVARDMARGQISFAGQFVEPAHDIATMTPEQVANIRTDYPPELQPPFGADHNPTYKRQRMTDDQFRHSRGEPVVHSPSDRA